MSDRERLLWRTSPALTRFSPVCSEPVETEEQTRLHLGSVTYGPLQARRARLLDQCLKMIHAPTLKQILTQPTFHLPQFLIHVRETTPVVGVVLPLTPPPVAVRRHRQLVHQLARPHVRFISLACCEAIGLDVVDWLEQDLVDILVPGEWELSPWEEWVALGRQHGPI